MQQRSGMCSPPDSIPLLQMMVKLTQAKKIVEVGVFTGATLPIGQPYLLVTRNPDHWYSLACLKKSYF